MKMFLIVGAVLMTGASIYGFIDYRKSSRSKNFTGLYKIQEPSTIVKTKQPAVEIKEEVGKAAVEVKKDNKIVKKRIAKSVAAPVKKNRKQNCWENDNQSRGTRNNRNGWQYQCNCKTWVNKKEKEIKL